jgi:alpha-glucosidase (family GH31 glycosyl hydrolase)
MTSTTCALLSWALLLTASSAARGYEYAGNVTSWARQDRGILLKCGPRQALRVDLLTERLFRIRFSGDGSFPESRLIKDWRLVKSNDDFAKTPFEAREEDGQIWLTTARVRIRLDKAPLRISLYDSNNQLLTRQSATSGLGAGGGCFLQMEKAAGEHFFGMGEGIGARSRDVGYAQQKILGVPLHGTQLKEGAITLDQTGKKIFFCLGPNWAGFHMTPVVIPFFMSTRGYGVYLNQFRDSLFDLGNANPDAWSLSEGGPPNHVPNTDILDVYFFVGPSFKDILDQYTDLTGRAPLLPRWSLGYFQICDFGQNQAGALKVAEAFRKKDLPCDMLGLEPGWMKTPYRMDGWSPEQFPHPDALVAQLRKEGFKLALWQCGPHDWIFTSGDLLKRGANQWGVDITRPSDVAKYVAFHKPYYDLGVAFFKQDGCGQSEWQPDETYANGLTGRELHNIIPTLYSKIMFEAKRAQTGRRALNFSPHAGPSGQRYPGIWPSGDGGGGSGMFVGELNLGLSGHTYTSHDFTDRSGAGIHWSLLGPWCPGALSGMPEGAMCRFYLKLRYRLIPYIYTSHWQAHVSGVPYLRAMPLEYPQDAATYTLDHQCMLGDWFLLAAYTKDVYLPAGRWIDYWSGEVIDSTGQWKRNCAWPATVGGALFVKGGAIIPMAPVTPFVDAEPWEIVTLDVYPHGDSRYSLYEDDGVTYGYEKDAFARTVFRCRQEGESVRIDVSARKGAYEGMPKNRGYFLSVHCAKEPARVLRGTVPLTRQPAKADLVGQGAAPGWAYDPERRTAWIRPAPGWYYTADERGAADPEKDTARWEDDARHDEGAFAVTLELKE